MKIQKGDKVIILKGKNKGTVGDVLSIAKESEKVVVSGVNIRTIHQKPKQQGEKGQIIKKEGSINISNVAYFDEKLKRGTRIGYKGEGRGKQRISKQSGDSIKKVGNKKQPKKEIKKAELKKKEDKKETAKNIKKTDSEKK